MVRVEVYLEKAGQAIASPFFDAEGCLHFVSQKTGEIFSMDKSKFISR
jgi:hypothetical protein